MARTLLIVIFVLCSVTFTSAQVWIEYYDSTYLYWEEDWEKAIDLLNKALPLAEQDIGIEHPNYAVLLNDLGVCYWKSGDFKRAALNLEKSLRIKKVSLGEEDPDFIASLLNLASILHDKNDLTNAEGQYIKVIESYTQSEFKDAYYLTALVGLGSLYEKQANYSKAEQFYLKALSHKIETAGASHPTYAKVLVNLANLYKKTGNVKLSEETFLQAITIYEKDKLHNLDFSWLLSDYGLFHADRGNFGTAEKYLKKSEQIILELKGNKSKEYASSLNNLGTLYLRMGKITEAESFYKGALALYEQLLPADSPELAPALNNLAGYYVNTFQFENARPLYIKTQNLYAESFGKKHPLYASSLNNLASLYRKTKEYDKAAIFYKEVLNIEKEVLGDHHPQYASSLQNAGLLSIATGNYAGAEVLLKEAIAIKETVLEPQNPSWAKTYNNLALLYFLQNKPNEAAPLFKSALSNQFNQIKNVFPALSEKEKESFYNTLKDDIERFNTFALSQYKTDPSMAGVMYNNQLITKGLLFDASNKIRENIFAGNDEALIEKYNSWRALRENLAHAYQLSKEALLERNISIDGLITQANILEKELSTESYALNPQGSWQELSWQDIKEKLSPDEAAIEIIRFREFAIMPEAQSTNDTSHQIHTNLLYGWTEKVNYAALIITATTVDNPQLILLDEGEVLEKKYFSYYANGIRYQVQDNFSYERYWKKIHQEIPDVRTVFLSPDGAFHKINVNTLYDTLSSKYLVNTVTIKQLTSTRDLYFSKNNGGQKNHAVIIGDPTFDYSLNRLVFDKHDPEQTNFAANVRNEDSGTTNTYIAPLPATKAEANKIYDILTNNNWTAQTFLNENALEENIKKVNSPKVLHIATHGFFNDNKGENPGNPKSENHPLLNSGLLLAGAQRNLFGNQRATIQDLQEEDGILTAFEAMNLKLDNTDLVILSACETGSGTIKNGEGVYGLQRSFQVAGTASIIFSLWKVDDEATQRLMTYFYKNWMATNNKREAFTIAQQELKKDYPQPYYWGAFILIGD